MQKAVPEFLKNSHAFIFAILLFIFATNWWMDWPTGIAHTQSNDVFAYLDIARAAPDFPKNILHAHYSERFATHYFLGTIANKTSISIVSLYRGFWFVSWALIFFFLLKCFSLLKLEASQLRLGLALLLLNPGFFRYYALAMGLSSDYFFLVGLVMVIWGLLANKPWAVVLGGVLGLLGRQTILPTIPAIFAWYFFAEKKIEKKLFIPVLFSILTIGTHLYIKWLTKGFSIKMVFLPDYVAAFKLLLPGRFQPLFFAEHLGRVLIPYFIPLAFLFGALRVSRRALKEWQTPAVLFLIAALIVAQPLGSHPNWVSHNEARLSALGLVPAILSVLLLFKNLKISVPESRSLYVLFAVTSLHHVYTWIGPRNVIQFTVVQLIGAALVFACIRCKTSEIRR